MPLTKEQLRKCLAGARNVVQKDMESEQNFATAPKRTMMREQNSRGGYNQGGIQYVSTDTDLNYESPYGDGEDYSYGEDDGLSIPSDMQGAVSNSRMPEAIKKSMMKEQIDVSALQDGGSVLDSLGLQGNARNAQRTSVYEGGMQATATGVNYSLIKQIITKCLDERLGDSTLKTIQVSDGKIRLVDNQGRIFTANLEYKGNIADKKKK